MPGHSAQQKPGNSYSGVLVWSVCLDQGSLAAKKLSAPKDKIITQTSDAIWVMIKALVPLGLSGAYTETDHCWRPQAGEKDASV